jgi:hypothetical protein
VAQLVLVTVSDEKYPVPGYFGAEQLPLAWATRLAAPDPPAIISASVSAAMQETSSGDVNGRVSVVICLRSSNGALDSNDAPG